MGLNISLKGLSTLWVSLALGIGVLSGALWFHSNLRWQEHLNTAYAHGVEAYYAMDTRHDVTGVRIEALTGEDLELANAGRFEQISDAPRPAYVTILSLSDTAAAFTGSAGLKIAVASDQLKYRVSEIASDDFRSTALQMGELTRLLATYCSDPIIYASFADGIWLRVDGTAVWGCNAAPQDNRLIAAALLVLSLAVLLTQIGNTTEGFQKFAQQLQARQLEGGPEFYEATGPKELNDMVNAVNLYLEEERNQLSQRAIVLSGVSHDLGTPATRLRLRAALIQDPTMRERIEADIDQMTGIIESVLTYTRSELNSEDPRRLSITSLVEALVEDYQDTGLPVTLTKPARSGVKAERSVFAPRAGTINPANPKDLLMFARPIALKRALSNLIDNALKYGRRASVSLDATSGWIVIFVEDEGGGSSASDMEALLAPFERGQNTQNTSGFGLGLTIVATVARQHGGRIEFEDGPTGVRAKLWLRRT